jgi:hypothetical protein
MSKRGYSDPLVPVKPVDRIDRPYRVTLRVNQWELCLLERLLIREAQDPKCMVHKDSLLRLLDKVRNL